MTGEMLNNSIFWVELEKIKPNPFQPRKEFNDASLNDLASSIRQYGVLQPLVVTRREFEREDGGLGVDYELISGERRLRASKLAGLAQVPVVIRTGEQTDQMKLELAIIENLQREDLNPIDRARAFEKLAKDFGYTHGAIATRVGKSREYVSNSIRMLALPAEIIQGLIDGKITEGHTRPLGMLADRPEEQRTLFLDIINRRLTVRDAERLSRGIAVDRVRKAPLDTELLSMERKLVDRLGTRVHIEKKEVGGKIVIDFFSNDDLRAVVTQLEEQARVAASVLGDEPISPEEEALRVNDIPAAEKPDDSDLYAVTNFSL